MNVDHDKLKKLFEGYAEARKPASRDRCPSSIEIVESFEPTAPARHKRRIVDHISSCPQCREEFRVILEHEELDPKTPHLESGRRERGPRVAWRLAGAALGLCLIVVSLFVVRHQWEEAERLRGVRTVILLLEPKPGQAIPVSFVFKWKSRVPAGAFVLEIFDETMLPVWTSEMTDGTSLQVPASVMSRLLPGKTYHWMITGYSGGRSIEESPLGRFSVRPGKR